MNYFETHNIPLVAYFFATGLLKFEKAAFDAKANQVTYLFQDPNNKGREIQIDFLSGALVSATKYFDGVRQAKKILFGTIAHRKESEKKIEASLI